jgi:hypothetical protein
MYSLGFKILVILAILDTISLSYMELDIYYVYIHNKVNVGRKAKMTSISKWRKYKG